MPNNVDTVLVKVETVYATDAAPTPSADAFIVYDWAPKPMVYDEIRRKIVRPFPGRRPKAKTRPRQGHPFKVELAGSGTANVATKWGSVLLRGCLFDAPVPNGAIDVGYPLGTAGDGSSLTKWSSKGNDTGGTVRMRAQGMRGNVKMMFQEGDLPYLEFDFLGLMSQVPDGTAIATPTLPNYPAPIEVNTTNTTFSLGGFAVLLRSLEIDLGMKSEYRSLVGQRAIIFGTADDGDRRSAGGRMVFECPDPTIKSYFADVANRTNLAMALVHGTATGNIIDLSSAVLQIDEPEFSNEQNRLMCSCAFDLIPSAAGNELTLKTR